MMIHLRAYMHLAIIQARRGDVQSSALITGLFMTVIMVALSSLWKSVLGDDATIAGYSVTDIIWYLAVAEASVVSVNTRRMVDIADEIRDGFADVALTRPTGWAMTYFAEEAGRAVARFPILLCGAGLVAFAVAGPPDVAPATLLVIPAVLLSICVHVAIVVTLAASVFWLGDVQAAWFAFQKLVFLVGGMLIPLEFWPAPMPEILQALPFAAIAYAPASIAAHPDVGTAAQVLALQSVWAGAMLATMMGVWKAAEAAVSRFGGAA